MGKSINDLIRILESVLGFERESGDHVRYSLKVDKKIIARTKFSHSWRGNQQISNGILSAIAKQLHCPTPMLNGLLQKRLRKEEYLKHLLDTDHINKEEFDHLLKQ